MKKCILLGLLIFGCNNPETTEDDVELSKVIRTIVFTEYTVADEGKTNTTIWLDSAGQVVYQYDCEMLCNVDHLSKRDTFSLDVNFVDRYIPKEMDLRQSDEFNDSIFHEQQPDRYSEIYTKLIYRNGTEIEFYQIGNSYDINDTTSAISKLTRFFKLLASVGAGN